MQKKHLTYGAALVVAVVGLYIWNMEPTYSRISTDTSIPSSDSRDFYKGDTSAAFSFTKEEVSKHNSATSCYASINGNVYDLTSWINQHPGGTLKILAICGRDGSALFNLKHGGDRKPEDKLVIFKIGTLAQ